MNWEKAILKIDVVKDSNCIIREIEGISRKPVEGIGDIGDLIAKYKDDKNRLGFIKRYAETQLATNGIKFAITAFILAIVSIFISIFFALVSLDLVAREIKIIINFILIVPTIALLGVICFKSILYEDSHINRYKAIIIAIEATELDKQLKK